MRVAWLLPLAALSGAGVLWLFLAAPELPVFRRRLAERARGLLRVDEVATDLAQAEMAWLSARAWIVLRWTLAAAAVLVGFAIFQLGANLPATAEASAV